MRVCPLQQLANESALSLSLSLSRARALSLSLSHSLFLSLQATAALYQKRPSTVSKETWYSSLSLFLTLSFSLSRLQQHCIVKINKFVHFYLFKKNSLTNVFITYSKKKTQTTGCPRIKRRRRIVPAPCCKKIKI